MLEYEDLTGDTFTLYIGNTSYAKEFILKFRDIRSGDCIIITEKKERILAMLNIIEKAVKEKKEIGR